MCDKLYLYKDKNGLDWLDVAGCELLLYLFLKTIVRPSVSIPTLCVHAVLFGHAIIPVHAGSVPATFHQSMFILFCSSARALIQCIYDISIMSNSQWTLLGISTLSLKNKFPALYSLQLCQILTDFQNFYTAEKRMKFATKSTQHYTPHLRNVATLPREIIN